MMLMLIILIWKSGYCFGAHRECTPETSADRLTWVGIRWFNRAALLDLSSVLSILTYFTFKPINCHLGAAEATCKHKPYIFTSAFTLIWLIWSAIINLLASSCSFSHAEFHQHSSSNIDTSFDFFLEKYVLLVCLTDSFSMNIFPTDVIIKTIFWLCWLQKNVFGRCRVFTKTCF